MTIKSIQKQLDNLLDLFVEGEISKEIYRAKSERLQKMLEELERANKDAVERNKNWYEVIGKTLDTMRDPNERFKNASCSGEKRSVLEAIGYNRVLKDRTIGVTPYKWVEKIKNEARKIEIDLDKVITSSDRIKNSSKELLFPLWSGLLGLNQRPHAPQACALPLRQTPRKKSARNF